MKVVVTGAAGFIGSHLTEELLKLGHQVTGLDHSAHPPDWSHPNFTWLQVDLLKADLKSLLKNVQVVFHLAGLAGVRNSWGSSFAEYLRANVLLTQNILEACRQVPHLVKLIYSSSSSVYGGGGFSSEQSPTRPISPYGLTKLTGEQLCYLYHEQYGTPYVALRYFTVYGPGQRPDMGFHRFMKAALLDHPVTIYGNGEQTRDFTYVTDVVKANIGAMNYGVHGSVYNIGGIETASVNEVLKMIEGLSGKKMNLTYLPEQPGDPFTTRADISLARKELGYEPAISLEEGTSKQWDYICELYGK